MKFNQKGEMLRFEKIIYSSKNKLSQITKILVHHLQIYGGFDKERMNKIPLEFCESSREVWSLLSGELQLPEMPRCNFSCDHRGDLDGSKHKMSLSFNFI